MTYAVVCHLRDPSECILNGADEVGLPGTAGFIIVDVRAHIVCTHKQSLSKDQSSAG